MQAGSAIARASAIVSRFFAHCANEGCVPALGRPLHTYLALGQEQEEQYATTR